MSSHHIVKEDQEPALIIDDVNAITPDQLGQLLEWSPTVVAHDGNLQWLVSRGIKIDVLFSNDKPTNLSQDHITTIPFSDGFLSDALTYLINKGYQAANIVANTIDPKQLLQYAHIMNATLLGNGRRIFVAKSGFRKWKPQGESIAVYGDTPVMRTVGLIQQNPYHYLTESDGFYCIWFEEKHGLVGELL